MGKLGDEIVAMLSRFDRSWLLYFLLLVFRIIVGPFLFGYVHPDEFFQGGQELFFGCPPTIPWEFEPSNALRSVFPPVFMTWLPLQLYDFFRVVVKKALGRHEMIVGFGSFTGTEVLIVPRIACSLFSVLALDWSVWSICNKAYEPTEKSKRGGVPIPVLLLASAWPTVVMLTRPFSNSMETYIFTLLMADVLAIKIHEKSSLGILFCWKIGIICALGVFTRFTFVFFAAPILLSLLSEMIRKFGLKKIILWRKLCWMTISFVCVSVGIILADTVFYSLRRSEATIQSSQSQGLIFDSSSVVVTPFNALSYNSKVSNLKDHGLHPRWTHSVVNMFIMYGPLTLVFYLSVFGKLLSRVGLTPTSIDASQSTVERGEIVKMSAAVVITGLAFLSIAPHQEPRFLLPLLIPLVFLGEKSIKRFPSVGLSVWFLFNSILLVLFGVLHQGGVLKSLLSIGSISALDHQNLPTSWIYARTYMPPTFLTRLHRDSIDDTNSCLTYSNQGTCDQFLYDVFGRKLDSACHNDKVRILDLKSSDIDLLKETIATELSCSNRIEDLGSNAFLYLVMPIIEEYAKDYDSNFSSLFLDRKGHFQILNDRYEWNQVNSYGPHLTTEDFPTFQGSFSDLYEKLALTVYNVSCVSVA